MASSTRWRATSVSDVAGELRIEPIKARHLADLDLLFAHGDPRSCQCAYLRLTNRDYQDSTPAANRSLHHQAIRAPSAEVPRRACWPTTIKARRAG